MKKKEEKNYKDGIENEVRTEWDEDDKKKFQLWRYTCANNVGLIPLQNPIKSFEPKKYYKNFFHTS